MSWNSDEVRCWYGVSFSRWGYYARSNLSPYLLLNEPEISCDFEGWVYKIEMKGCTQAPIAIPSSEPTIEPTTGEPTLEPTMNPTRDTVNPTTSNPTNNPTTISPSTEPSRTPTSDIEGNLYS